jgi:hypothetical protein
VSIANPTEGSLADQRTATVTIVDDDPPPQLSFSQSAVSVGESQTSVALTVAINGASASPVSVGYATNAGSATAAADFTASSGTLTSTPGDSAAKTITIALAGDTTDEPDETFTIALANAVAGTIGSASSATVAIIDDEPPRRGGGGRLEWLLLAALLGALVPRVAGRARLRLAATRAGAARRRRA